MKVLPLIAVSLVYIQLFKCQEYDQQAFHNGMKVSESVVDFINRFGPSLYLGDSSLGHNQIDGDTTNDEETITLKDLENAITGAVQFMRSQNDEVRALNLTNILERVKFVQDMLNSTEEIAQRYQGPVDDIRNAIVRMLMTEMMANFPEVIRQTREFFFNAQKTLEVAYKQYVEEVGDGNQSPQLAALMRIFSIVFPTTIPTKSTTLTPPAPPVKNVDTSSLGSTVQIERTGADKFDGTENENLTTLTPNF